MQICTDILHMLEYNTNNPQRKEDLVLISSNIIIQILHIQNFDVYVKKTSIGL